MNSNDKFSLKSSSRRRLFFSFLPLLPITLSLSSLFNVVCHCPYFLSLSFLFMSSLSLLSYLIFMHLSFMSLSLTLLISLLISALLITSLSLPSSWTISSWTMSLSLTLLILFKSEYEEADRSETELDIFRSDKSYRDRIPFKFIFDWGAAVIICIEFMSLSFSVWGLTTCDSLWWKLIWLIWC